METERIKIVGIGASFNRPSSSLTAIETALEGAAQIGA